MRKLFVFLMCCFMLSPKVMSMTPINFITEIIDKNPIGNQTPKSPMRPPLVYIEDYTLTFSADHPDYILIIKDEEGEEVYTTTVFSAQTLVTLPSTLFGDYEIQLQVGNWLFTGLISCKKDY